MNVNLWTARLMFVAFLQVPRSMRDLTDRTLQERTGCRFCLNLFKVSWGCRRQRQCSNFPIGLGDYSNSNYEFSKRSTRFSWSGQPASTWLLPTVQSSQPLSSCINGRQAVRLMIIILICRNALKLIAVHFTTRVRCRGMHYTIVMEQYCDEVSTLLIVNTLAQVIFQSTIPHWLTT